MIKFGTRLGSHSRLRCSCGTCGTRVELVTMISRSKPARSSGHVRLNVVGLL
jgi:hypothetical protein